MIENTAIQAGQESGGGGEERDDWLVGATWCGVAGHRGRQGWPPPVECSLSADTPGRTARENQRASASASESAADACASI